MEVAGTAALLSALLVAMADMVPVAEVEEGRKRSGRGNANRSSSLYARFASLKVTVKHKFFRHTFQQISKSQSICMKLNFTCGAFGTSVEWGDDVRTLSLGRREGTQS